MRYCENCGKQISEEAKFCPACGTPASNECGMQTRGKTEENPDFIKQYLKLAVQLESSLYAQNRIIEQVQAEADRLGIKQNIMRPSPPPHYDTVQTGDDMKTICTLAGFGAVIGGIIGLFTGGLLLGAAIGGIGVFIITWIWAARSASSANSAAEEEYGQMLDDYRADCERDERRVKREQEEKKRLVAILSTMKEKRDETKETLRRLYEKDIIFSKYRTMVPICSFYEYFVSRRCSSLTGHEGAYNIYENEVRLERIYTKLDEIVEKLELIRENQYVLYDAIRDVGRTAQKLVQESVRHSKLLESTAESTALSAHYAQIAASNAEASAWIGLANYQKKQ